MKRFPRDLIQDGGGCQHPKDRRAAPRSLKNPQGLQGKTSGGGGVCGTHSIAGTTKTGDLMGRYFLKVVSRNWKVRWSGRAVLNEEWRI